MNKEDRLVLGSLATVAIPDLGIDELVAKVDTGAFSGALHCTHIFVEKTDDEDVLHFTPLGNSTLATSTKEFRTVTVRSASGHKMNRYVIPVTIVIDGKKYSTQVGLWNREVMKREMLLGRRFLIEHNALVDVSLTKELDDEAEMIEE